MNRIEKYNRETIDLENEELMYPVDLEKMVITTKDGNEKVVTEWLADVMIKLPTTLRYRHNNQLVDHAKELVDTFRKKGKRGVLQYVKDCALIIKAVNSITAKAMGKKYEKQDPLKKPISF